jgi:hypothetical protein
MVGTMALTGGEHDNRRAWAVRLVAHVAGGVLGGATVGALAYGLGWVVLGSARSVTSTTGVVLAVLLALMFVAELGVVDVPVPGSRRQVPRRWDRDRTSPRAPFAFGFALGLGVTTRTRGWLMWAYLAACALVAPAPVAVLAGALFGGVRAGLAVARTLRHRSAERAAVSLGPLLAARRTRATRLTHAAGCAALALTALAALLAAALA